MCSLTHEDDTYVRDSVHNKMIRQDVVDGSIASSDLIGKKMTTFRSCAQMTIAHKE
jgi:hypothetical protein